MKPQQWKDTKMLCGSIQHVKYWLEQLHDSRWTILFVWNLHVQQKKKSQRLSLPGPAWSLWGPVRQKSVWVPEKHNPLGPLGHVLVLHSTTSCPLSTPSAPPPQSYVILFYIPPSSLLIPYTFPSSSLSLPAEESLHHSLLTLAAKQQRPSHPFTLLSTSDPHRLLLPLPHKPLAFPFCIVSPQPLLSWQRERVGREWRPRRKRGEERRGERGERRMCPLCSPGRTGPPTSGCGNSAAASCFFFSSFFLLVVRFFTPLTYLCHIFLLASSCAFLTFHAWHMTLHQAHLWLNHKMIYFAQVCMKR